MTDVKTARLSTRYGAWANGVTCGAAKAMPEGNAFKRRRANFRNMAHTQNHICVIDRIFQAHPDGRDHGFSARNAATTPALEVLWKEQ